MKIKRLSHEETMEWIRQAQNGDDDAKTTLIQCNERLVWSVVQRFSNRGYELEDLFQIGMIGMLKSITKFDLSFNVKFSTYAVPMITGEIQRFLRDDGPLKVSRSVKELAKKIKTQQLTNESEAYIAECLYVTEEQAREALEYIKEGTPASLQQTIYENDGDPITIEDQLPNRTDNWFEHVALREALAKLDDRNRCLLELRYFQDKTQHEVAKIFGVSQVQVSRIERNAIRTMRELLGADDENEKTHTLQNKKKQRKKSEGVKRMSQTLRTLPEKTAKSEKEREKEKVIHLLKTTRLGYKEIESQTTLPYFEIANLGKKHRSKLERRAIMSEVKKRAHTEKTTSVTAAELQREASSQAVKEVDALSPHASDVDVKETVSFQMSISKEASMINESQVSAKTEITEESLSPVQPTLELKKETAVPAYTPDGKEQAKPTPPRKGIVNCYNFETKGAHVTKEEAIIQIETVLAMLKVSNIDQPVHFAFHISNEEQLV